jgi:hypothetical protein
MDLKVATLSDINDELERRKMLERQSSIKDHFERICIAYNSGKIDHILLKNAYRNQNAEKNGELSPAYVVYLKPEEG